MTRQEEDAELERFVDWYCTNIDGIEPDDWAHTSQVMKTMREKKTAPSEISKGLRQAVNDIATDYLDNSPEEISSIDERLRRANLPTFTEVHLKFKNSLGKVIKRGKIRNETEYYLAKNALCDAPELYSKEDLEILEAVVGSWE